MPMRFGKPASQTISRARVSGRRANDFGVGGPLSRSGWAHEAGPRVGPTRRIRGPPVSDLADHSLGRVHEAGPRVEPPSEAHGAAISDTEDHPLGRANEAEPMGHRFRQWGSVGSGIGKAYR